MSGDKVTRLCPQTTTCEEKGEPKRIRTEVPPLTSLTPYRQAEPAHGKPFSHCTGFGLLLSRGVSRPRNEANGFLGPEQLARRIALAAEAFAYVLQNRAGHKVFLGPRRSLTPQRFPSSRVALFFFIRRRGGAGRLVGIRR